MSCKRSARALSHIKAEPCRRMRRAYLIACGRSQRGVPRAIWYGLEFLRYATASKWLRGDRAAFLRGYNTSKDFDRVIKAFSKTAKKCARATHRDRPLCVFVTSLLLIGSCCATCVMMYDSRHADVDVNRSDYNLSHI